MRTPTNHPEPTAHTIPGTHEPTTPPSIEGMTEATSPRAASQAGSMDTKPRRRIIRLKLTADTAPQPGTFLLLEGWSHRIEKVRHLAADRYEVTLSRRA